MTTSGAVLLAFALFAGAAPKSSRTQVSSNGRYSVRAIEPSPGQCRLEVSQEAEIAWELPHCLGSADDLYFVSNDGERVWVLKTLPEMPEPPRRKRIRTIDLVARAQVAFLVDRAGQVMQSRTVGSFMPLQARKNVQVLSRHFKWLEGAVGVPGKAPRSNAHNQVEFEVMGPKTVHLDF